MVRVIDARPNGVHLKVYAGDDLHLQLAVIDILGEPEDLTGCTAQAQIRATADATEILAEFDATVAGSVVYLHLAPADSAALAATPEAVWDAQITYPDTTTLTVARGNIQTTTEVTR